MISETDVRRRICLADRTRHGSVNVELLRTRRARSVVDAITMKLSDATSRQRTSPVALNMQTHMLKTLCARRAGSGQQTRAEAFSVPSPAEKNARDGHHGGRPRCPRRISSNSLHPMGLGPTLLVRLHRRVQRVGELADQRLLGTRYGQPRRRVLRGRCGRVRSATSIREAFPCGTATRSAREAGG